MTPRETITRRAADADCTWSEQQEEPQLGKHGQTLFLWKGLRATIYILLSYMWAPKEISATLKVREVRYFIKHQFGGIPPPLPQGEGRQMRGGSISTR